MELVVEPLKLRLAVDSGKNLLDVLRANEVPISYSCMSGRCGTCRCRVVDGDLVDAGPETGRPQTGVRRAQPKMLNQKIRKIDGKGDKGAERNKIKQAQHPQHMIR